jgi:hypothetical protein
LSLDGQPWSQRAEAGSSRAHKRAVKRLFIGRSLRGSPSFFKIKNPKQKPFSPPRAPSSPRTT